MIFWPDWIFRVEEDVMDLGLVDRLELMVFIYFVGFQRYDERVQSIWTPAPIFLAGGASVPASRFVGGASVLPVWVAPRACHLANASPRMKSW